MNTKSKLYQYAVIYNPQDENEDSKLLIQSTSVLAKNEKALGLKVAREIPEEYIDKLDQVEIVIRSF